MVLVDLRNQLLPEANGFGVRVVDSENFHTERDPLFNYSVDLIEDALRVIQSMDPPGVGARNLQECMLLHPFDVQD